MQKSQAPVYIELLNHPIQNRKGELVTTSVTNLDIHDISRTVRTFGIRRYFIVTPLAPQRQVVQRILDHWKGEASKKYHPDRAEAVSLVDLVVDFQDVKAAIVAAHGEPPEVLLTDARPLMASVSYADFRRELQESQRTRPVMVVFGPGWGIEKSFFPEVHRFLAPVHGPEGAEGYNHLSVRAAVAIILDRLFGI